MQKIALITGATSGIGQAVAIALAEMDYHCICLGRSKEKLAELKNKNNIETYPIELTDNKSIDKLIDLIKAKYKKINLLFNSAGILATGTSECDYDDFHKMFEVNVMSLFYLTQQAIPLMRHDEKPYIFNLSSMAGKRALPFIGTYAASKFAVTGLSEALYIELAKENIKVTTLCPSAIDTPMTADFNFYTNEEKIKVNDLVETVKYCLKLGPTAYVKEILIDTHKGAAMM